MEQNYPNNENGDVKKKVESNKNSQRNIKTRPAFHFWSYKNCKIFLLTMYFNYLLINGSTGSGI